MGIELPVLRQFKFFYELAPKVIIMAKNYEPENSWNALNDPLPQQTHVYSPHCFLVNAIQLDHVEEVQNDGHAHPGKIYGREHDGRAVGASLIHSINVWQFYPEQWVIYHIRNEGNDNENDRPCHLQIVDQKQPTKKWRFVGQKHLSFCNRDQDSKESHKNRRCLIKEWLNFDPPEALYWCHCNNLRLEL